MDRVPPDCPTCRELVSARADGESPPDGRVDADGVIERHLAGCDACREFEEQVFGLRRITTMGPARRSGDGATAVLARLNVPDAGQGEWVRYLLGVVGGVLVLVNLPLLVFGATTDVDTHTSRHLGAFGVALGVGLFIVALRPERARGLLPLAAALGVAMTIGAVADLVAGRSTVAAESTHLVELLGLVLLWVLSGGRHRLRSWRGVTSRRTTLRSV